MAVVGGPKKRYYGFFFECSGYSDLDRLRLDNMLLDKMKCSYAVYVEVIEPELHIEGMIEFVNPHTVSAVTKMIKNSTVSVRTTNARDAATKFRHMNGARECGNLPKGSGARTDIEAKVIKSKLELMKERALAIIKNNGFKLDTGRKYEDDTPSLDGDPAATLQTLLHDYMRLRDELVMLEETSEVLNIVANKFHVHVAFGTSLDLTRVKKINTKIGYHVDAKTEYFNNLWHSIQGLSTVLLGCGIVRNTK